MAESHVVSALVAKRGELAGEAEHCRRELQRVADELGHLDATIRLFDPDYPLAGIRPWTRRRRSRVTLDSPALRAACAAASRRRLAAEIRTRIG